LYTRNFKTPGHILTYQKIIIIGNFLLNFSADDYISAMVNILHDYDAFSNNANDPILPCRDDIVTENSIQDIKE
jgi:hypothetical protein